MAKRKSHKSRLPSPKATNGEILRAINTNHYQAIGLSEIARIILYDEKAVDKFNNTIAAEAFTLLQYKVHEATVLALSRLWDKGSDYLSIPNLVARLADAESAIAHNGDFRKRV
jgi:hypothetical protein